MPWLICLPFQCLVGELNYLLLSTHKRQSLCLIRAPSIKNKNVLDTIFSICDIDLGLQCHISNLNSIVLSSYWRSLCKVRTAPVKYFSVVSKRRLGYGRVDEWINGI